MHLGCVIGQRAQTIAKGHFAAPANDAAQMHGVVINPDKSKPVTFSPGDRIIVLAES